MIFFVPFLKFIFIVVGVLISVAFLTLLERKVLGLIGIRVGPNKVFFIGVFQPFFDAMKLMNKQANLLNNFSFIFYYLSSSFLMAFSIFLWLNYMGEPNFLSFKFSVLIVMMILGFNSLNSIITGWSTFSKYSLLGSLRTLSQLISYEAVLYLCFFILILFFSSFSLYSFNFYLISFCCLICPICLYIWLPSILAELNRTPYDFSEGESELVSGFNTEFGSSSFTLIFLSEYMNIMFFSLLSSFFFFYFSIFFFFFFFFFFIIWIRSVLPRFRFDKLMYLAWKFFIPFLSFYLVLLLLFFLYFEL